MKFSFKVPLNWLVPLTLSRSYSVWGVVPPSSISRTPLPGAIADNASIAIYGATVAQVGQLLECAIDGQNVVIVNLTKVVQYSSGIDLEAPLEVL